jgi:hypothetical protein
MASIRAIKRGKVCGRARSLVTCGASRGLMRNLPPGVRECRARPCRSCMACRASARSRETVASVIRNRSAQRRGALPVRRVATVTIGWRHGGSEVAKVAGRRYVCSGQGETGSAVVKHSAEPIGGRVAGPAGGWIGQSDVVRSARIHGGVCRVCIIRGVAAVASGRQRAAVVAVHVAQGTGNRCVRARQRKSGGAVIERGSRPVRGGVADRTIGREACRNMIWNRGAGECHRVIPIGQMAAVARGGAERVVVAHVAGRARSGRRRNMRAC